MLRTAVIAISAAGIIGAIVWHGSVQTVHVRDGRFLIFDRVNRTAQSCSTSPDFTRVLGDHYPCTEPMPLKVQ